MTRSDVEKLLGGHATGTLTEAERRALYGAALEHQDLFDALMDDEALRELLADPEARATLLAALEPAAPKVVPFWRRTGVLGTAAGLLLASLAGLAYLRNPVPPPPLHREAELPAPAAPAPPPLAAAPAPAPRRAAPAAQAQAQDQAVPPPPSSPPGPARGGAALANAAPPTAAPVAAREEAALGKVEAKRADAEASSLAEVRKARAQAPAAVVEVLAEAGASTPLMRTHEAVADASAPGWHLTPGAGGLTQVELEGPRGTHAVLLQRGRAGVRVVSLEARPPAGGRDRWRGTVHLQAGEVLDFYLLATPPADPAALPPSGPVAGQRVRIHPPQEKSSAP